jgi:ribosomal protein L35
MSTKTNKSFSKRLKVTKNGKVLARRGGKNHFNAKESRSSQLSGKRYAEFKMTKNDIGHYMPNA